jgi:hypothetical protein
MIAVKFQSQNPNNTAEIPDYWIWKKIEIDSEEAPEYQGAGWTTFTETAFAEYERTNKVKMETHYMAQLPSYKYLDISIKEKKAFADDLIDRLKKKNITEGINGPRGLWVHERTRALSVTLPGVPYTFTVDLMNMVISGDLELACLSLMYSPADDMTLPWHWLSAERKNWIINELKLFLGWP